MSVNAEITGKAGDIFNGKTVKIRTEPVGTSKDWMRRDGIYGSGYYSQKAAISDMASRAASAAEYMPSSDLGARETSGYNPHKSYTATEMLGDKSGMLQLANIGEKNSRIYIISRFRSGRSGLAALKNGIREVMIQRKFCTEDRRQPWQ